MPYFLVRYAIRHGAFEYGDHLVIQAADLAEAAGLFERAREIDESDRNAGILLHDCYEEALSLEGIREITDAEFQVLDELMSLYTLDAADVDDLRETYGNGDDSDEAHGAGDTCGSLLAAAS
jgi:hypothetical protein